MKIAVAAANGKAAGKIINEAVARGTEVTAFDSKGKSIINYAVYTIAILAEIEDRSICIDSDIGEVLKKLKT